MVPLSVQLAPQRAAQIMCVWVYDSLRMQCSFNLQIKSPLYSAPGSAKEVQSIVGNWLLCGEKPPFSLLHRFSPIMPCLQLYLFLESCTYFVDRCLPVRRYAEKRITVSFCTAGQNFPGSTLSVYYTCLQTTSKYCKPKEKFRSVVNLYKMTADLTRKGKVSVICI